MTERAADGPGGTVVTVELTPTERAGRTTVADLALGWWEFIADGSGTTHVAYLYEDGSIYFPEGAAVVTDEDFLFARAAGRAWRLVRAANREDDHG